MIGFTWFCCFDQERKLGACSRKNELTTLEFCDCQLVQTMSKGDLRKSWIKGELTIPEIVFETQNANYGVGSKLLPFLTAFLEN